MPLLVLSMDKNKFIEAFERAKIFQWDVSEGMLGRLGDPDRPLAAIVATFVVLAGEGDYCEIGTLWGGSAVTVALTKKYFGIAGKIICVDPLDGYYMSHKLHGLPNEKLVAPVSPETLMSNADKFGVSDYIEICQSKSYPWPRQLARRSFSVTLIDGNHWGLSPYCDWMNVRGRTSRYVIFDNCNEITYPDVWAAAEMAATYTQWSKCYNDSDILVLEHE